MRGILGGAAAAVIIPHLGIDPAPVEAAPPLIAPPGTFTLTNAAGVTSRPMRLDAPLAELQRGIDDLFDANPPALSYWMPKRGSKKHFDITTFEAGGMYRQRLSIPVAAVAQAAPGGPIIITFAGAPPIPARIRDYIKYGIIGVDPQARIEEVRWEPAGDRSPDGAWRFEARVWGRQRRRAIIVTGADANGVLTKAPGPIYYTAPEMMTISEVVLPHEIAAGGISHARFMRETQGEW